MFSIKENSGLVAPWIIGILTFMALEAVAMVYGNVLKDHIFGVCYTIILKTTHSRKSLSNKLSCFLI